MNIIVEKDYDGVSKRAAEILNEEIKNNPNIVLGLATGSTPIGMYKELIEMQRSENVDYSNVKTFNLDEYVGLAGDHPKSYRYFMNEEFFKHVNIDMENTNIPDGKAIDLPNYCKEYDESIEVAGGIDIQILGIGQNGHIAFNEPAEELNAFTSVVGLTESTINVNSRFFNSIDEVPKTAITMGIATILRAKKIILLASGKNKGGVIKKLRESRVISTQFPASILLCHPDVTIIVDNDAYVD